jgi:hypothetical protein
VARPKISAGPQRHARVPSPSQPHGNGLVAATSANRAGKRTLAAERTTVTSPCSRGWRSASQAARGNSASSSMNSTPRWARVQK